MSKIYSCFQKEVLSHFDDFKATFKLTNRKTSESAHPNGYIFQLKTNSVFTVYSGGLDEENIGYIEIALSEEYLEGVSGNINIANWINEVKSNLPEAKSKKSQKWHRVAIKSIEHLEYILKELCKILGFVDSQNNDVSKFLNSRFTNDKDSELFDDIEQLNDENLDETERKTLTLARVGQGQFRKKVLTLWGKKCALTGMPIESMLIASHIKAWRDCDTNEERLCEANGILLCAHVDKLFDNYLITFEYCNRKNDFCLRVNPALDLLKLQEVGIYQDMCLDTSNLNFSQESGLKTFLMHHQERYKQKIDFL